MFDQFIAENRLPPSFIDTATIYYMPLVEQISVLAEAKKPIFIGINGCQGSGKSTFVDFVEMVLTSQKGLNVVSMSLDDFYYASDKRRDIAKQIHPLFLTRGVPGTHDVEQLTSIIKQVKFAELPISIPRFNKATDEPKPTEQWPLLNTIPDVVLIEGWCWGVPAQNEQQLDIPVNALESEKDNSTVWRSHVNALIKEHYEGLYAQMDYWICLKAPSFDCVYQWRLEQENKLRDKVAQGVSKGTNSVDISGVMNEQQVRAFIEYFRRLTEHSFNTIAKTADAVLELDAQRQIKQVHYHANNSITKNRTINIKDPL